MKVMPIFINFLAVDTLKVDNVKLEKYCLHLKGSTQGRVISNGGGWQSDNVDLAAPELRELLEEVHKRLVELHRYFDFHDWMRPVINEAWVNINNRGHFNYAHKHPGSVFSCVYYVKGGPNHGNLELVTPIAEHGYTISENMVTKFNSFTGTNLVLPATSGELAIFPGWLSHQVRPNCTDDDRISIALNSGVLPDSTK
jgi:uncharacterized protein (TIGR02466 family)